MLLMATKQEQQFTFIPACVSYNAYLYLLYNLHFQVYFWHYKTCPAVSHRNTPETKIRLAALVVYVMF